VELEILSSNQTPWDPVNHPCSFNHAHLYALYVGIVETALSKCGNHALVTITA
jgi:hypothetical protein